VITRETALLLLDKLCESERVRCGVKCSSFGLWIEGKLRREGNVVFLESPSLALDLHLTEGMMYEFGEPRNAGAVGGVMAGLAIALPLRFPDPLPETPPPRDKIVFQFPE
jgi:hypothetical protein